MIWDCVYKRSPIVRTLLATKSFARWKAGVEFVHNVCVGACLDPVKQRLNHVLPNPSWKICGLIFFCRADSFLELDGRLNSSHSVQDSSPSCSSSDAWPNDNYWIHWTKAMEGIGRQESVVAYLTSHILWFSNFLLKKCMYVCVMCVYRVLIFATNPKAIQQKDNNVVKK